MKKLATKSLAAVREWSGLRALRFVVPFVVSVSMFINFAILQQGDPSRNIEIEYDRPFPVNSSERAPPPENHEAASLDDSSKINDTTMTNPLTSQTSSRYQYKFPTNITSYEQLENMDINVRVPKNLNMIIVGDSVSRYLYTSLVYFLKFGEWINVQHPFPIAQNQSIQDMYKQPLALEKIPHMRLLQYMYWSSKEVWSNYCTGLFSPCELCDFRDAQKTSKDKNYRVDDVENRYFRDPIRNNSIVYVQKFADTNNHEMPLKFISTWSLDKINTFRNRTSLESMPIDSQHTKPAFGKEMSKIPEDDLLTLKTSNWTEFVLNFVSKMEPKPNAFVFNQGLWPHIESFREPACYKDLIKAISDAGMISIYKTTTKLKNAGREKSENELYEKQICELTDYCLDLSWTSLLPDYLYYDNHHFFEPVYSWMNIGLLDLLFQ